MKLVHEFLRDSNGPKELLIRSMLLLPIIWTSPYVFSRYPTRAAASHLYTKRLKVDYLVSQGALVAGKDETHHASLFITVIQELRGVSQSPTSKSHRG